MPSSALCCLSAFMISLSLSSQREAYRISGRRYTAGRPAGVGAKTVSLLLALVYLMAPAYLGNMAAPFVKYWKGWNRPISERWLGAHKTVAGFLLGVIVALGTAFLQSAIDWKGSLVDYAHWPALGLALGIGALGGDALKSLVKRARGIAPGKSWVPFDQLDFAVGALALVWPWARLGWSDALLILAFTFVADIVVNHAACAAALCRGRRPRQEPANALA